MANIHRTIHICKYADGSDKPYDVYLVDRTGDIKGAWTFGTYEAARQQAEILMEMHGAEIEDPYEESSDV